MKIIDISMPINNDTPIYPGNIPVSVSVHQKIPEDSSRSSGITLGSHTGTHIDAPSHAILGAKKLDEIPLNHFIGKCQVLDFSKINTESVTKEMLLEKNIQKGDRIILKTQNSIRGLKEFYPDYVYLSGEGAEYLASLDVMLVGIDALSIKQKGSADHRPHLALLSKNIPIIEGLNLRDVEESNKDIVYEIFCPPIYLTDIDGAPSRAILIQK